MLDRFEAFAVAYPCKYRWRKSVPYSVNPPGPLIPEFMRHILWQAQYCE